VDDLWKAALRRQYGAAIDMLENAISACPDALWGDRTRQPEFWYVAYHTLFFLDLYLSGTLEGFAPPPPFTMDEIDPAGVMPERVYTKEELLAYLRHARAKFHATLESMTDEQAAQTIEFPWLQLSRADLLLNDIRHVQHHTAQLNLILRQVTDSAPRWVAVEGNQAR
jgi:hypothetical protein